MNNDIAASGPAFPRHARRRPNLKWTAAVAGCLLAAGCSTLPPEEDVRQSVGDTSVAAVGTACGVDGVSFAMPTVSVSIGIGHYVGGLDAQSSPAFALGAARMDDMVARLCASDPARCLRMRLFSLPSGGVPGTAKAIANVVDAPSLYADRFAESANGRTLPAANAERRPTAPGALETQTTAPVVLERIRAAADAADYRARREGHALLLVYVAGALRVDPQRGVRLLATDSRRDDPDSMIPLERIIEQVGAFTRVVSKTRERRHAVLFIDGRDAQAGEGVDLGGALSRLPSPPGGMALVITGAAGGAGGAVNALEARTPVQSTHFRMPSQNPARSMALREVASLDGGREYAVSGVAKESIPVMAAPIASACALERLTAASLRSARSRVAPAGGDLYVHAEQWVRQMVLELDRLLPADKGAAADGGRRSVYLGTGRPFGGPILKVSDGTGR